jgi:hypothetical protein
MHHKRYLLIVSLGGARWRKKGEFMVDYVLVPMQKKCYTANTYTIPVLPRCHSEILGLVGALIFLDACATPKVCHDATLTQPLLNPCTLKKFSQNRASYPSSLTLGGSSTSLQRDQQYRSPNAANMAF